MGDELQDAILRLVELRPDYLTEFEKNLVNDRLKAIQDYKDNAVVTKRQKDILWAIVRKVKRTELARRLAPL